MNKCLLARAAASVSLMMMIASLPFPGAAQTPQTGYRFIAGTSITYQRTITTESPTWSRKFTEVLAATLNVEEVDALGNATIAFTVLSDTVIAERTRPYRGIMSDLPIPDFKRIRVVVSPRGRVISGVRLDGTPDRTDSSFARRQAQKWFLDFTGMSERVDTTGLVFIASPVFGQFVDMSDNVRRDTVGLHVKLYNFPGPLNVSGSPCRQIVISRKWEYVVDDPWWDGRLGDPDRTRNALGAPRYDRSSFHSVVDACLRGTDGMIRTLKETKISIHSSGRPELMTDVITEVP